MRVYREKRSAWLDTMYMKNQLISWKTHLRKLSRHGDEINRSVKRFSWIRNYYELHECQNHDLKLEYNKNSNTHQGRASPYTQCAISAVHHSFTGKQHPGEKLVQRTPTMDSELTMLPEYSEMNDSATAYPDQGRYSTQGVGYDPKTMERDFTRTGLRVKERIDDIVDEYEDKIRDCMMRVDGMAMASQWVSPITGVLILLTPECSCPLRD